MKNIHTHLYKLLRSSLVIFLGVCIWHLATKEQTITTAVVLPLYLYNVQENDIFDVPETIAFQVSGTREQFWNLQTNELSVHCNALDISHDATHIARHQLEIFLPTGMHVVHYTPVQITRTSKETTLPLERYLT